MTSPDLLRELRTLFFDAARRAVNRDGQDDGMLAVYERGRRDGATQQRDELSVLVAHSGATDRREWHTVGAWLYPGEAIYEGRIHDTLVTDADK